jgi:hypothetical protein
MHLNTNSLMLFREIAAVYSDSHTGYMNMPAGTKKNSQLFSVEGCGKYIYHCALNGTACSVIDSFDFSDWTSHIVRSVGQITLRRSEVR